MTKASNDYCAAHGCPNGNQDKKQTVMAISHTQMVNKIMVNHIVHRMRHFVVRIAVWEITTLVSVGSQRETKGIPATWDVTNVTVWGHKRSQCPMLKTNGPHKTAAMRQVTYVPSGRKFSPHQCNDSRGEGEIKLACGCIMPVVAGALSPNGQVKLKEWRSQMTPCCKGRVNDTTTLILRDTGSTTCVVKSSLVKPEQMTITYELCMLIDGVVKRYPTAVVDLDTPYYTGTANVLCIDTSVQDIIVGNIPVARGPDTYTKHGDVKYTSHCIADKPQNADKQWVRPCLKLIKL